MKYNMMPSVPETDEGQYEIKLRDMRGNLLSAVVDLGCRDWTDSQVHHVECRITLNWDGGELEAIEDDFFDAFCLIREQLEQAALYPVCYGADRRIVISGMARDMALGLKVYKVQPDNSISVQHLVDIFETGEDIEPVSLQEQLEFQQQWYEWRAQHQE